jgi:hypothetical protein
MIRIIFTQERTSRNKDRRALENFYYTAMYDTMRGEDPTGTIHMKLRQLKAKIIRLQNVHKKRILIDTDDQNVITDEEPSLYHVLRRKRQESRMVMGITDDNGNRHTTPHDILRTLTTYARTKYDKIPIDEERMHHLLGHLTSKIPTEANDILCVPFTMDELKNAVRQGKQNKAPGHNGIPHDFFLNVWETIQHDMLTVMNQMYMDGTILGSQKHGIIVCVPKKWNPERPADYRFLTLLNANFKLLSRLIANRLRPWMRDII